MIHRRGSLGSAALQWFPLGAVKEQSCVPAALPSALTGTLGPVMGWEDRRYGAHTQRVLLKYTFHMVTCRVKLHIPTESSVWEEAPTAAKAPVCFSEVEVSLFFEVGVMVPPEADWAGVTVGSKGMSDVTGIYLASLLRLRSQAPTALPRLCSRIQPRKDRSLATVGLQLAKTPNPGSRVTWLLPSPTATFSGSGALLRFAPCFAPPGSSAPAPPGAPTCVGGSRWASGDLPAPRKAPLGTDPPPSPRSPPPRLPRPRSPRAGRWAGRR